MVSENDIPVVKVLVEKRNLLGMRVYKTPFMLKRVSRNVIQGKKALVASGKEYVDSILDSLFCVEGGYIHTFAEGGWDKGYGFPRLDKGEKYVVFKCVIPAGERFFWDNKKGQYASKSIRFIGRLDEREYIQEPKF